jgi:hypothetical protein
MKITRQVLVTIVLLGVIACSWLAPLKEFAMTPVDLGLKRALVTFASARALSGLLSVVQAAQVDIQPAGIGVTLSPGQVLAPVNEVVKNFADLMLMVCVAFGIQKFLISISDYWLISASLTVAALTWTGFHLFQRNVPRFVSRLLVIMLMLRFAAPLAMLGTDVIFQEYLISDFVAAQKAIEKTTKEASNDSTLEPPPAANPGWMPKIPNWLPSMSEVKAQYVKMKEGIDQSTEHIIKLIVIFLLQTMFMPLLMTWFLFGLAKANFGHRADPLASRKA